MLDLIFLVLLIIGTYSGYKKGFLLEIIGIIAIFIGLYGAFILLKWALGIAIRYLPDYGSILPVMIFILLVVIIMIAVNIVGKILKKFIDATPLGTFDNLAGAILGLFMWSFLISLMLWLLQQASIHLPEEEIHKSYIYPHIVKIAPAVGAYLSSLFPFAAPLFSGIKELFIK